MLLRHAHPMISKTGGAIKPGRVAFVRLTYTTGDFCFIEAITPRNTLLVRPIDRWIFGWRAPEPVLPDAVDDVMIDQEVRDMLTQGALPPLPWAYA